MIGYNHVGLSKKKLGNSYNEGIKAADNRANPSSANYKTGYNAGVVDADNRTNTNSNNYKSGYNRGVADADGRANANSNNYKTGFNNGVNNVRYIFSDGSSFRYSDIITGQHACDGTIIPIVASVTRVKSATFSKKYRMTANTSVNVPKGETSGDSHSNSKSANSSGISLSAGYSYSSGWANDGSGYPSYSANISRVSAWGNASFDRTDTVYITDNVNFEESAIFLPMYYSSLNQMANYKGGTAKAWIKK